MYDADTRSTSNVAGVETRVPGFGDTSVSVEWISKSRRGYSVYFANIVQKLLQQVNSKISLPKRRLSPKSNTLTMKL